MSVSVLQSSMESLAEAFRAYLSHERYASGTIMRYIDAVSAFFAWLAVNAGDQGLQAVTRGQVRAFLEAEDTKSPSAVRWNIWRAALCTFFAWLEEEEVVMHNPAKPVHRIDVVEHPRETLTLEQMLTFVATVEQHAPKKLRARDVAILQLFFHSALRVAEVVKIDLSQLDLPEHIHGVVTKGDRRLTLVINNVVATAIEDYLAVRQELGPDEGETALFLSQRGTRLAARTVEEMVTHYAELAGLPAYVTPHVLRHSSATELIDFTDIRTVQEHLGHKLVTTTQRYTHVRTSKRRAAVIELGQRWERAKSSQLRTRTSA